MHRPPAGPVPKVCGADIELGSFIVGAAPQGLTCGRAARALLQHIDGHSGGFVGGTAQDWGRKYLASNGGCVYIDLDHPEVCIPEVRSAYDFVAYTHALFRIARQAQVDANQTLPSGQSIEVLANNSDGQGDAYGSHVNLLTSARAWEAIFSRKLHHLLYLASYQVSSIIFTGQGKVGAENGRPDVPFQISARGDFFETLVGTQTTYRRPIVNARQEPLCGRGGIRGAGRDDGLGLARLHVIFFDNTLCHVATFLKIGVMQIILTMIECARVNLDLILEDPLAALQAWSHDPTLQTTAATVSGRNYTAVELQLRFLEEAARFTDSGACAGLVPDACEIMELWQDTLLKLQAAAGERDPQALGPLAARLDWALKLQLLRRAMARRPQLRWESPQAKHLDHLYSSLSDDGLYWTLERDGAVETLVSRAYIEQCMHQPPADTRAWTRAMLLRQAPAGSAVAVDWDHIQFNCSAQRWWPVYRTIHMDSPLALTAAAAGPAFREACDLGDLLDHLEEVSRPGPKISTVTDGRQMVGTKAPRIPQLPEPPKATHGREGHRWQPLKHANPAE